MGQYIDSIKSVIRRLNPTWILIGILIFAFITKAWRLGYPDVYVFDEIYAGFTAEQYAQGNPKAWIYDYEAPKGFAYNWDHPPLGRLIMSSSIRLLGQSSLSRRVMPLLAGVLITLMVYKLSQTLFPKKPFIWLVAAFLSSLDGLILTLSRIALADSLLTLFIITCVYFLLNKKYLLSGVFFGAAASIKWTGSFLLLYIVFYFLFTSSWSLNFWRIIKNLIYIGLKVGLHVGIAVIIYLASYTPLFINYGFEKFIQVQQQMYWYHSRLVATHPWQSPALSWPLMIKPVWFWVDYQSQTIANIFALGNPIIFWNGVLAVLFTLFIAIKTRQKNLFLLLAAYPACWLPWAVSPRIMFLYHYLPGVPFLIIILAFTLYVIYSYHRSLRPFVMLFLGSVFATFVFFYPYWTGIAVPKDKVPSYQWLNTWKP